MTPGMLQMLLFGMKKRGGQFNSRARKGFNRMRMKFRRPPMRRF